jgi:broad specificity phosphatase PhoE
MSSDVPLSPKGKERAEALKNVLQDKKIQNIFSTNTIRTQTTAKPTSDATGVNIDTYDPRDTAFVARLKTIRTEVL